ncbi:hypothetical protein DFS30_00320 [Akkermansia muciniphila]|nr:hypothetical protein CXT98_07585 [Akkermansia muciniphila]PNC79401.1 hypothetical protein CXT92_09830 [Akkermansia muciniphila]PNC86370.1 hypothetical protein CXT97_07800 [Akkermansia muciniphila]PNC87689.1 hypothetical protein CXT91_12240 [Akkermansia muciniphila]PNC99260.1 hypothetical protein CXT90_06920 [Akkermansia muciniphila]
MALTFAFLLGQIGSHVVRTLLNQDPGKRIIPFTSVFFMRGKYSRARNPSSLVANASPLLFPSHLVPLPARMCKRLFKITLFTLCDIIQLTQIQCIE